MPILLHIDTAIENASVCISENGVSLALSENTIQKEHAAWLHPAIESLLKTTGVTLQKFDAITVSNGPGSYTGLRAGLATAKGICFALNKPLITLNTLEVMTVAARSNQSANQLLNSYCPMIDARRMEVFTAIYDRELRIIQPPHAAIIHAGSFAEELKSGLILFFGSGAKKFEGFLQHSNAMFATVCHNAEHMITLAEKKYGEKDFADLAYAEPFYIKDFHTATPSK